MKFLHSFNSLTLKLSSLFAITAILLLAGSGTYLYQFLERELMQRDHQELLSKVELFRQQLKTYDAPAQISNYPAQLLDIIMGQPHLHLTVRDADSHILLTSSGWHPVPGAHENPVPATEAPGHRYMQMPTLQQPWHSMSAWCELGGMKHEMVLLELSLDIDEAQKLLASYQQKLLFALFVSIVTAVALTFIISRRSLRPLNIMASTASEISANHLQKRLNVLDAPTELKALASAFNDMLARLHDSFARLSEFSSDLAHELRTPINNLMGQTQVTLSRERSADEYRAVLESNLDEYERLARMIRDMLFLAKTDNAQETLHAEALDLRKELDKIAEFYQVAADERNIRITVAGDGMLNADRILLQRAAGNLLTNAIRHAEANSDIRISVSRSDKQIDISISNRGAGIPEGKLARVFNRFYRLEAVENRSESGSGLGLAIVKSIMELHGGSVSVSSTPGTLTTFTLHFPE